MSINDYSVKNVEVTSLYFKNKDNKEGLEGYPRRMVLEGREYNFLEDGLRFLIKRGGLLIKLFDVSDGDHTYRLKLDGDNWTLIQSH